MPIENLNPDLPVFHASNPDNRAIIDSNAAYLDGRIDALAGLEATTLYIATTGNDTTGTGASGAPFATLAKALSELPRFIGANATIVIADGTYAAPIDIQGFACAHGVTLKLQGNGSTPSNVVFTGTVSKTFRSVTSSCGAVIAGPVRVEIEGVTITATATTGLWVMDRAQVLLDRVTVGGTLTNGVQGWDSARFEFSGNITIQNFTSRGLQLLHDSSAIYVAAGTLTITGQTADGTKTSWNVHIAYHSRFTIDIANVTVSVVNSKYGFQVGMGGLFQHMGTSGGLVSITNSVNGTAAVWDTDCSSWSVNSGCALTIDHFARRFDATSLSYVEFADSGTYTVTNTGADQVLLGGVVYAP